MEEERFRESNPFRIFDNKFSADTRAYLIEYTVMPGEFTAKFMDDAVQDVLALSNNLKKDTPSRTIITGIVHLSRLAEIKDIGHFIPIESYPGYGEREFEIYEAEVGAVGNIHIIGSPVPWMPTDIFRVIWWVEDITKEANG